MIKEKEWLWKLFTQNSFSFLNLELLGIIIKFKLWNKDNEQGVKKITEILFIYCQISNNNWIQKSDQLNLNT